MKELNYQKKTHSFKSHGLHSRHDLSARADAPPLTAGVIVVAANDLNDIWDCAGGDDVPWSGKEGDSIVVSIGCVRGGVDGKER